MATSFGFIVKLELNNQQLIEIEKERVNQNSIYFMKIDQKNDRIFIIGDRKFKVLSLPKLKKDKNLCFDLDDQMNDI